jgi:hypothetical protein
MSSGFSIEDLKGQIGNSGGLAKGNQFMVTLPQIESFKMDARELNLFCTVATLPGRQIMSIDHAIGTTNRKFANGYATTDMTMTFLVANNHLVRQYFENWQNEAHNQLNRTVGYFDDYTYPVTITTMERGLRLSIIKKQLGFTDKIPSFLKNRLPKLGPIDLAQGELDAGASFEMKKTYQCTLLECYPTSLTDQQLGNGEEGVLELSVQLSFTDWESEVGDFTKDGENIARGAIGGIFSKLFG